MTDDLNEVGKVLRITNDTASAAAKRDSAEYPMEESVRDIFDAVVPYNAYFKVKKGANKVNAILSFELPPPNKGQGTCCGDCYCAIGETFPSDDEDWGLDLVLQRPYVPGSVRLGMADFMYPNGGITETDPEAGIVTLSNAVFTAGRTITVYYVYAYADCTTNIPPDPCAPYSSYLDDFDRAATTFPALFTTSDNMIGTQTLTACMEEWDSNGGQMHASTWGTNDDPIYEGWYLDGDGNAVNTFNNGFNSFTYEISKFFESTTSPYPLVYTGTNINCDTEIRWKTDHIPGDIVSQVADGFFRVDIGIWDGGGSRYEWQMIVSSSGQTFFGQQKGIYFGPSQTNDYFGMNYWPFSWAADTWYIFKARTLMDGTVKWKMWVEADAEPDWFEESWDNGGPYPWTLEQIDAYNAGEGDSGNVAPGYFEIQLDGAGTESPAAGDTIPLVQYNVSFDYIKMTDPT